MSSAEVIERERRGATVAASSSLFAVGLILLAVFVNASNIDYRNDRTLLVSAHSHAGGVIVLGVIQGIGFALLCVPLLYLFRAAQARSERVRGEFVIFVFLGPILFAVQSVLSAIVITRLGSDFAHGAVQSGKAGVHAAKQMLDNSNSQKVAADLRLPAALAMLVAIIYISLQSMRVGLLTRFWGSLGIALGVSLILIPFGSVVLLLWLVYVGLLIGGWLPRDRPPAWAAGEAIPWPTPGERMAESMQAGDAQVAGEAGEHDELEAGEPSEDAGEQPADPVASPGERRKRKRRR